MNEEEEHSMHIPGSFEMQCDACTAVAYQVSRVFVCLLQKLKGICRKLRTVRLNYCAYMHKTTKATYWIY